MTKILATMLVLGLLGCAEAGRKAQAQGAVPPNILVVMTDDQRWDEITPAIMPAVHQRLVNSGATFTQAFVTTGLCCPSRTSFLTGNCASRHGVHHGNVEDSIGLDADTIATRLHAAGYRTGIFGKYLGGYWKLTPYGGRPDYYHPPGWDAFNVFVFDGYVNYDLVTSPTTTRHYDTDYSTDVVFALARQFIQQAKYDGVPWFVLVTPYGPHESGAGEDNMVPPRHLGLFAGLAPWRPASWMEPDVSDKAQVIQNVPVANALTVEAIDVHRQARLESLRSIDEGVQSLWSVQTLNGWKNDVIVFTSDNGFFYGEHRMRHAISDDEPGILPAGKNRPYDEAHRVPLVIRYPKKLSAAAQTVGGLVTLQDVTAALAWWGTGSVVGQDGINFAATWPVMTRTSVPLEAWWPDGSLMYAGMQTATHKLFTWGTGEIEEYDLSNDPLELESVQ